MTDTAKLQNIKDKEIILKLMGHRLPTVMAIRLKTYFIPAIRNVRKQLNKKYLQYVESKC